MRKQTSAEGILLLQMFSHFCIMKIMTSLEANFCESPVLQKWASVVAKSSRSSLLWKWHSVEANFNLKNYDHASEEVFFCRSCRSKLLQKQNPLEANSRASKLSQKQFSSADVFSLLHDNNSTGAKSWLLQKKNSMKVMFCSSKLLQVWASAEVRFCGSNIFRSKLIRGKI